jgi:hypothetical protein
MGAHQRIADPAAVRLNVEIEDEGTWPKPFREEMVRHRRLSVSFHTERRRIDHLAMDDVRLRIHRPTNEYQSAYSALIDRLEALLVPHLIVAYHCTRLTPREVAGVRSHGLRRLSQELVRHRLADALKDGHLTCQQHEALTSSQAIRDNLNDRNGGRVGMIWFCPNRSTLQDSGGVHRLFRSWGGEAVYCGQEEDGSIGPILSRIGTPCIVKCAVAFSDAEHYAATYSERFVSQFLADVMDDLEPSASFDLHARVDIGPNGVIDVIVFDDPRFLALTHHRSWPIHENI